MASITPISLFTFVLLLATSAADIDLLQDICVADLASDISATDFFFDGLANPGLTNTTSGAVITGANVQNIPGPNTLGVSLARIDYAPGNVLISKSIKKGEIFVFPKGLVHFQKNNGKDAATVVAAFNSQFPGTQSIATTLFATTPSVPNDVLTKAFQVGTKEVEKIKSRFAPTN
ncbi:unnamed protein product [Citrullus colocynthis]|uniref:Germin-like protein n=1 Tax=Citrullus colocynthis TaxID=252529 RepID=A0ABP0ZCT8_9ROSI